MATEIGSLIVRVGSDISGLTDGLEKGGAASQGFAGKVRGSIDVMGKLAIAAAATGAAIVAAMVTRTMDAIDAQAKLARQLDATSKGLANLQHAGNLAGVGAEEMEGAMRKLNSRVGEAAQGSAEMAELFARLRLSADELSRMDADERVATLNARINEFIPAAEQGRVYADLFGRGVGTAMREVDAEAIAAAAREVQALGLAVSEVDAAGIERANDAMTTLRQVMTGVANRITVAVAPVIEAVAVALKDSAVEAEGFKSQIETAMTVAVRATGYFLDALRGLQMTYTLLQTLGQEFLAGFLDLVAGAARGVERMLEGVRAGVNATIRALNAIPGVNIAEIAMPGEREWIARLEAMAGSVRETAAATRGELEALAARPLPSEGIEEFLARIKQASAAASEAAIAARQAMRGEGSAAGGKAKGPGNEAEAAALAEEEQLQAEIARLKDHVLQRVLVLQEGLLSEEEQRQLAFERQVEQLQEALAWEQLTVEQFHALRQQLEEKHMKDLAKIRERGWTDIQRFENATLSQQAKTVADHLAGITSGVARENKTMFEINKVAGIAQAIVNAYIGISKTLSSYPYPINVGLAAAHAAVAFAQVNAIRSQQFGGGGAAPSLAGSTAAPPVTPVPATDTSAGGGGALDRTITVSGISEGEIFSGGRMRALIDNLLEEQRNGARVVLV